MALRQEAQKRNWVPAVMVVVLLGAAGTLLALQFHPPRASRPSQVYFFDLTNDQLFAAATARPPIVGPSGDQGGGSGTAVWAHVFSCGSCANEAERFVGYLENRSGSLQKAAAAGRVMMPLKSKATGGMEVADPEDKKTWVGANTAEGKEIVGRATSKCGEGTTALACVP